MTGENAGWAGKISTELFLTHSLNYKGLGVSVSPEHSSVPSCGMCVVNVNTGPQRTLPKAWTEDIERQCYPTHLDRV